MRFQFDHLVHFVNDPKEAVQLFRQQGVHAVEGGVHENRGTYNALSYFDLSYVEFLSAYDKKLIEERPNLAYSLIETVVNDSYTEGFARIAIRTTQIEHDAEYFARQGLTVNGPVPLSRRRPDGSVVSWRLLYIGHPDQELPLPFIIQWDESDEERRSDLTDRGVIAPHPAGDLSLSFVAFAVKDAESTAANWAKWLGLKPGEAYVDESLQARCQPLLLPGGNLVFASPIGIGGAVSEVLAARGERAFLAGIAGGSAKGDQKVLGGIYRFLD
ncbi:VOC family protein [Brevibacillus massiliensis]|uniref:VOC family protein n=1 Tax=Brevibacillus massiliensis TaxID=1118054 RepID=UPI000308761B|nr:VOC family protein [Brevibacillus massiliensis]